MAVVPPTLETPGQWQQFVLDGALAMGVTITETQAGQLFRHAGELARWNRKFNLTTISDPPEVAVKHFIDSIVPARFIRDNTSLLDIGTGGGFPGLPLKIVNPSLTVTLADAVGKKVNFVRQVIRVLDLAGIDAIHERLENLREQPDTLYDVVICRAFTALDEFVRLAWPLVSRGGQLIAMKSDNIEPEIQSLKKLLLPGPDGPENVDALFTVNIHSYDLFHLKARRTLIVLTRN